MLTNIETGFQNFAKGIRNFKFFCSPPGQNHPESCRTTPPCGLEVLGNNFACDNYEVTLLLVQLRANKFVREQENKWFISVKRIFRIGHFLVDLS